MSTIERLRQFVSERLTALTEEMLEVFCKTIEEYEEEIQRQRMMLDIILKPVVKLHKIDQPICKEEEVHTEQQSSDQQMVSTQTCFHSDTTYLYQRETQFLQIKEEPEEFCTSLMGEHFAVKKEDDAVISSASIDMSKFFPLCLSGDKSDDDTDESDESDAMETFPSESETAPNTVLPSTSSDKEPFSCSICGRIYRNHSSLERHAMIHKAQRVRRKENVLGHSVSSQTSNHKKVLPLTSDVDVSELQRNQTVPSENGRSKSKIFSKTKACYVCGKTFRKKSRLNIHMRVHTGEKPYPCATCGRSFSQISTMKMHTTTHESDRPFPCGVCGKQFSQKGFLKIHMRTHTGDRPYTCSTCGKCFLQKAHLNIHVRTHTGERPYSCAICGKTFLQRSNLNVHMKKSHTLEQC